MRLEVLQEEQHVSCKRAVIVLAIFLFVIVVEIGVLEFI
jgi:hypothetical protein